jgi:hypothetical protein
MDITTYIIPAGNLNAVRNKLKQASEDQTKALKGVLGMFTVALTPVSIDPETGNSVSLGHITHYCSSGQMSAEEEAWIEGNLPKSLYIYKGSRDVTVDGVTSSVPWTPWDAFEAKGLKIVQGEL